MGSGAVRGDMSRCPSFERRGGQKTILLVEDYLGQRILPWKGEKKVSKGTHCPGLLIQKGGGWAPGKNDFFFQKKGIGRPHFFFREGGFYPGFLILISQGFFLSSDYIDKLDDLFRWSLYTSREALKGQRLPWNFRT